MLKGNNRIIFFWIALILGIVTLLILPVTEDYRDPNIAFSYESGFYDEPISVELSAGDIYYITYTLDGSEPQADSTKYDGPILIKDASENENVWSMMTETSLRYYEPEYFVPDYNIDKCTVLRAATFDCFGRRVSSDVREYFVGYGDKEGYDGMFNLCVSANPEDFFSEEYGIYHAGEFWKGKIESCKIYNMFDRGGNNWDGPGRYANWDWSGKEAERLATIELFNPDGDLLMRENCGVRISGKGSRNEPQKSLKFIARTSYSGQNRFSYDVFGEGVGPQSFLIHNFGDDFYVKMIDYVVYSALRKGEGGYRYTPTIPCNLFLEGEYWGPMFLEKTVSTETLSENFKVSKDNIILIKTDEVKLGDEYKKLKELELNRWEDLQEFIRENDMSISKNYSFVCSQMDIEDFAEYAAIQIYMGNSEWHLRNNFACWRTLREEGDNPYTDGRWRFCLFDVNGAFASEDTIWECMDNEWDTWYMVKALCRNEEFKEIYLKKLSEMEKIFAPEIIEPLIEDWSSVMEEPIRCHFKRFTISGSADDRIKIEKKQILTYCQNRRDDIKKVNEWFFE